MGCAGVSDLPGLTRRDLQFTPPMAMHFSYGTFEFPAKPTEGTIFWEEKI